MNWVLDAADNPTSATDPNGSVFSNTFDALNRLTAQAITRASGVLGTTSRTFEYDGLSRSKRLTDNNNPSDPADDAEVVPSYDGLSRELSEAQKLGANSKTVSFSVDGVGNPLTMTYPDSLVISFASDEVNRISRIHRGPSVSANKLVSWVYAGFNRTLERDNFDGAATPASLSTSTIAYDGIKRMTQVFDQLQGGAAVSQFNYGYDKVDNRLWEEKLHDPASSERDTYDKVYRVTNYKRGQLDALKQIPNPVMTQTWTLDEVHNWSQTGIPGGTETRTHDVVHQVTTRGGPTQPDVDTAGLWPFEDSGTQAKDWSAYANHAVVTGAMQSKRRQKCGNTSAAVY